MPTIIIAGVDGTGDANDATYRADMANSYVNVLVRRALARGAKGAYHRGPTLLGNETGPLGAWAQNIIRNNLTGVSDPKIVLTGYSRGGASAITAAQLLGLRGIFVDVLVLFDAVDRSVTAMADTIPPNVRKVFHARRSLRALSRVYFGNCGTSSIPFVTSYTQEHFLCTHGGVGGCPWWNSPTRPATVRLSDIISEDGIPTAVTYQQDLAGAATTWTWMAPKLAAEGII